jgi:hypothetical protein
MTVVTRSVRGDRPARWQKPEPSRASAVGKRAFAPCATGTASTAGVGGVGRYLRCDRPAHWQQLGRLLAAETSRP